MYLLVGSVVLIDVPTDDDSIEPNEFLDREIVSRKKLGEFKQFHYLLFIFLSSSSQCFYLFLASFLLYRNATIAFKL